MSFVAYEEVPLGVPEMARTVLASTVSVEHSTARRQAAEEAAKAGRSESGRPGSSA